MCYVLGDEGGSTWMVSFSQLITHPNTGGGGLDNRIGEEPLRPLSLVQGRRVVEASPRSWAGPRKVTVARRPPGNQGYRHAAGGVAHCSPN